METTLKRKHDDAISYSSSSTHTTTKKARLTGLGERVVKFADDIEKWDESLDAEWVREEIDAVATEFRKVLKMHEAEEEGVCKEEEVVGTPPVKWTGFLKIVVLLGRMSKFGEDVDQDGSLTPKGRARASIKEIEEIKEDCKEILKMMDGKALEMMDGKALEIASVSTVFKEKEISMEDVATKIPTAIEVATAIEVTPAPLESMTLVKDGKDKIVESILASIKITVDSFDKSCNLSKEVRDGMHNTVVHLKKALDVLGVAHPEGLEDYV